MAAKKIINCKQCIEGKLVETPLNVSSDGTIISSTNNTVDIEVTDLKGAIIAPGFLELQTNGAVGFHFAHEKSAAEYTAGVHRLAQYLPSTGVTGFFPTIPTVPSQVFKHVLPHLKPQDIEKGASVLGAHVEGPFLAPSKKGAHDARNMHVPEDTSLEDVYGSRNLKESIRVLTLAPEIPGAMGHIRKLTQGYGIHVSMGHSAATHDEGLAGMQAGAKLLTHTFNAMNSLHHREPGLPGLISTKSPPHFSIIADAIHLHPSVVSLAYLTRPSHCILITDSIELSGLPDGIYPGHAQIPHQQLKVGNKVTINGTDTLIGTCIGLDECVRNLSQWANVPIEEAVRCVTENVSDAVGLKDRGKLEVGRRADFVILDGEGVVQETWIRGVRVFTRS